MKKLFITSLVALFTFSAFVSCEPETSREDLQDEFATGHGEVGDPEDQTQQEGGN